MVYVLTKPKGIQEVSFSASSYISPCPVFNTATLFIDKRINPGNAVIKICNTLGQTVRTISNINSHNVSISKGNLQSGVYFYRLLDKQGALLSTGKFIVD